MISKTQVLMPPQQHQTKALQDQLQILRALSTIAKFANGKEIASLVDLPIETVRTHLKLLWTEDCLFCLEANDFGTLDYNCRIEDKGRAAIDNPELLEASRLGLINQATNQTTINGQTVNVGFINNNGTVHDFSQNIGQHLDEINEQINSLRQIAQSFPEATREEIFVYLDDLQEDIEREEKRRPDRIKTRIRALIGSVAAIAVGVAGVTDFSNNLLDLAKKLHVADQLNISLPHLQQYTNHAENQVDLAAHGISCSEAEILRANLSTFAEDWDNPEMSIYDNYDAAKAELEKR